ncbi:hypothetical protein [Thiohalomonas denitrificans]|nr:hypothetical protein [Thiohalomonas denitrificans]
MNAKMLFRIAVIAGAVTYVAYWFLPYTYGYLDTFTGSLLSYGGHDAVFVGPELFHNVIFVAWLVAAVGLLLFRKLARSLFLILVVTTMALSPLYGLSVETAGGATLISIANMADGVVLALAYFSPVKNEFY